MEQKVKLVVQTSGCPFYRVGDEIVFNGPIIDKEKSGNFCMMAMNAVFPYVYAARKGVDNKQLLQCPDCDDRVYFEIKKAK
ncbi:TIGR04076 family protein [Eubacteriaceae bacterium ES3]|nr:TIGR04076 family protein [Eubacteriaceae bacterium ES3]